MTTQVQEILTCNQEDAERLAVLFAEKWRIDILMCKKQLRLFLLWDSVHIN